MLSQAGGGLYGGGPGFVVENSLVALNTVGSLTPGEPPFRNDCAGFAPFASRGHNRSEEHTSELQSRQYFVCRLLLEKKNHTIFRIPSTIKPLSTPLWSTS